ncbi:hypothetical protein GA830_10260 [Mesorhizobium sp. NBSH29]|uniref:DUF1653 domain-containing protein n=1 Tax=Mesorhizobium sp. NBSH29 TaxID=2654249 RepID=UPI001896A301|nr:DUF1653 domain-containing protein [Mesorhizobium sp. NBSH29]QPC87078.1 hypothetical protein GA830_10260 [Mesorhizobium sp. NBSH29]
MNPVVGTPAQPGSMIAALQEIRDKADLGVSYGLSADLICEQIAAIARSALATPPAPSIDDCWQPTHQHVKRGSTYRIEGYASLQTTSPCEETAVLVIYRAKDGKLWARPHDEFNDGRFIPLATNGSAA